MYFDQSLLDRIRGGLLRLQDTERQTGGTCPVRFDQSLEGLSVTGPGSRDETVRPSSTVSRGRAYRTSSGL